jgi:hypothetical protein
MTIGTESHKGADNGENKTEPQGVLYGLAFRLVGLHSLRLGLCSGQCLHRCGERRNGSRDSQFRNLLRHVHDWFCKTEAHV